MESFVAQKWAFVRFGGGGAQSDLWAQVLADALDCDVHQLTEPRATNARGAAFLAWAELGAISIDDVPGLLDVHAVREPDPAARMAMDIGLEQLSTLHPVLGQMGLKGRA